MIIKLRLLEARTLRSPINLAFKFAAGIEDLPDTFIRTRFRSVCCVASRYSSHRLCRVGKYDDSSQNQRSRSNVRKI